MKVKIKRLSPNAVIPRYARPGDAGLDLTAVEVENGSNGIVIYRTGLAFEIPEGYVGYVFPRSSVSFKHLQMANSVGVIDSSYRGEVTVVFRNTADRYWKDGYYRIGDRVAQLVIMPIPFVTFEEVDTLSQTLRGEGGYGSTGN